MTCLPSSLIRDDHIFRPFPCLGSSSKEEGKIMGMQRKRNSSLCEGGITSRKPAGRFSKGAMPGLWSQKGVGRSEGRWCKASPSLSGKITQSPCHPDNLAVGPALSTERGLTYKNTLLDIYFGLFTVRNNIVFKFWVLTFPMAHAGGRAQTAEQLGTRHLAGLPWVFRPDPSTRLWGAGWDSGRAQERVNWKKAYWGTPNRWHCLEPCSSIAPLCI